MKIVLFGGTFDPVHIGHLFLAEELIVQLGYDRVVFVPAAEPPHKEASGATSGEQRVAMLRLATAQDRRLCVDDCEILRGGQSYTVDTVPIIQRKYRPTGRLGLVVGDDLLGGFQAWRDYERLLEMVDIVVAHRLYREELQFDFPHLYIRNLMLPVSSSDIRTRIREGRAYRHIVPESVFRYIEEHTLYGQRD